MKQRLIKSSMVMVIPIVLLACGGGNNALSGQNYYSASYSSYYNIESGSGENQATPYLSIVSQDTQYVTNAPLTATITTASESQFTFSQNGASGTVTIKNGNLAISYNSVSGSWTDFATQNIATQVPNGNYNLICDQTNLSACSLAVTNNQISITEYSRSGQATVLCSNSPIQQVQGNDSNPYLFSFNCSVNGGSTSGVWYMLPMIINNQTSLLLSEYNPAVNNNDDTTDEIAFVQPSLQIRPNGLYTYVYNGGSLSSGAGTNSAQFSTAPASLVNSISCNGTLCVLNINQYYSNQQVTGFDWYTNTTNFYNLTGSDIQNIYQDSFEGFYF